MKCQCCDVDLESFTGFNIVHKVFCSLDCLSKLYTWPMIFEYYRKV